MAILIITRPTMLNWTIDRPHVDDMVSLKECSALFRRTGHGASVTTISKWIDKHHVPTERRGRATQVSYTDMLKVHREEIARRDGE